MESVESAEETLKRLQDEVGRVVVGQVPLVEGLLIGLLSGGHVLVEGVPGLAKTTAVRCLAQALGLDFGRVQFTPDLLPGDLTGNPVFLPDRGEFSIRRGPIFTSMLLADEINRAPAKVQSALLEAMEERQVTIGEESLALPDPFLVMATQNPVELEGTYPLPEAQLDRFLLKLCVPYPSEEEEIEIVRRDAVPIDPIRPIVRQEQIAALRSATDEVHASAEVCAYAVALARGTRAPRQIAEEWARRPGGIGGTTPEGRALAELLQILRAEPLALGASPRASIYMVRAARARALLSGRRFVTPHDVKRVAPDVLRHRLVMSYEAEADGIGPDDVVEAVLASTPSP
jgi:MoxR-like ATPase